MILLSTPILFSIMYVTTWDALLNKLKGNIWFCILFETKFFNAAFTNLKPFFLDTQKRSRS